MRSECLSVVVDVLAMWGHKNLIGESIALETHAEEGNTRELVMRGIAMVKNGRVPKE